MDKRDLIKAIEAHVRVIVNNWDPIGLLEEGAPTDEYAGEIQLIVAAVFRSKNDVAFAREIGGIFKAAFNVDLCMNDCVNIAEKIRVKFLEMENIGSG